MVYMDLSKTSGKVPHSRLVQKVRAHGIQCVLAEGNVEHYFSDTGIIINGEQQASVQGPLLRVIYTYDLENAFQRFDDK